ncbi:hypothetical protein ABOM_009959 [Aspergillus bombycis]|uniref:RING-type domain-containing protein n=1 Tax=Aspergillus bombycis TaxID=109264 RepID=A0A1F7ZQC9_9EURO|nr:hypothetical protein ABOM_009959 [Aspergillus bombycis]OGM41661.1 hypothetical protein ABOM_009959 [Aspergillus bombycis]
MPSRYSLAQTTSLPHLSEILKLYPEEERWCAGYAPSQGRRCHLSTNAGNRQTAMHLLDEGTKDLHAGRDISDLLEELAPYTLCTRWHKYQALDLAAKWKSKVQQYLGSCVSPAPTQRVTGERQRISPPARSRQTVEAEWPDLANWAPVCIGGQLWTVQGAPATSQETRINERVTQTANSTNRRRERSMSGAAVATQERTNSTRAAAESSQAGLRAASPAASNRGLSSTPTAAIHTTPNRGSGAALPSTTSTRVLPGSGSRAALSSTTSSSSGNTTRRPIEGDCGICFDPLKKARCGASHGVHHDTGDEEEQQALSWCKAQCGVNYHTTCIESWLKAAPKSTCPTCRRAWKD